MRLCMNLLLLKCSRALPVTCLPLSSINVGTKLVNCNISSDYCTSLLIFPGCSHVNLCSKSNAEFQNILKTDTFYLVGTTTSFVRCTERCLSQQIFIHLLVCVCVWGKDYDHWGQADVKLYKEWLLQGQSTVKAIITVRTFFFSIPLTLRITIFYLLLHSPA